MIANPTLDERATNLEARYRSIQTRVRGEVRRRVAAGETIPLSELRSASRTLGLARTRWERMEAEAANAR